MTDQEIIQRTTLTLVNADRSISLLLSKLQGLYATELKSIQTSEKNINVEFGYIENNQAKKLMQELQDIDIFNFSQDLVELIRHIENSQDQLIHYIREMKKLV